MKNIHYSNIENFEYKKKKIKNDGKDKVHILADFDGTLTKAYSNGKKIPGIFQIVKEHNLLGDEYTKNGNTLFNKYYPIERDINISIEDKIILMQEWWEKAFDSLLKHGYNLEHVEYIGNSNYIKLRELYNSFNEILNTLDIPLIVMSASGTGNESIEIFLEKNSTNSDNIKVISNSFIWDSNGKMIGYNKPIIHSYNKSEILLKNHKEIHDLVKERKNVILLGDSIGDIHMVDGFKYHTLIKIGYLNFNKEELIEHYKDKYDVIITGDADMSFINNFLKECF